MLTSSSSLTVVLLYLLYLHLFRLLFLVPYHQQQLWLLVLLLWFSLSVDSHSVVFQYSHLWLSVLSRETLPDLALVKELQTKPGGPFLFSKKPPVLPIIFLEHGVNPSELRKDEYARVLTYHMFNGLCAQIVAKNEWLLKWNLNIYIFAQCGNTTLTWGIDCEFDHLPKQVMCFHTVSTWTYIILQRWHHYDWYNT